MLDVLPALIYLKWWRSRAASQVYWIRVAIRQSRGAQHVKTVSPCIGTFLLFINASYRHSLKSCIFSLTIFFFVYTEAQFSRVQTYVVLIESCRSFPLVPYHRILAHLVTILFFKHPLQMSPEFRPWRLICSHRRVTYIIETFIRLSPASWQERSSLSVATRLDVVELEAEIELCRCDLRLLNEVVCVQLLQVLRVLRFEKKNVGIACALSTICYFLRIDAHSSIVSMSMLFFLFYAELRSLQLSLP